MARNKHNTPIIIKYPFWQMTTANPKVIYVCINYREAYVPERIAKHVTGHGVNQCHFRKIF